MGFDKKEDSFANQLIRLALPISFQQMITASLAMVDVLMVASLGTLELATLGLISKIYFVTTTVLNGLATGAGILIAQYAGKKNHEGINAVYGRTLVISLLLSIPAGLLSFIFPQDILQLLSNDQELITTGTNYLKITSFYHVFTAMVLVAASACRSTNRPWMPMASGLLSIFLNTGLNYLLIFGKLGLPALGIDGAAIATVASRSIELALLLSIMHFRSTELKPNLMRSSLGNKNELQRLLKPTIPLVLNVFVWSMGVFTYFMLFGRLGRTQLAAMSLLVPFEGLYIEFFVGFGIACSIILGNMQGTGQFDRAYSTAKKMLTYIPAASFLVGLMIIALRMPLIHLLPGQTPEVEKLCAQVVIVMGLALPIRMFNMTSMMGVLRSGGDTKYALFIDVLCMWGLGVPSVLLSGFVLKIPFVWVYSGMMVEEVAKMLLSGRRVKSKKWINNLVEN